MRQCERGVRRDHLSQPDIVLPHFHGAPSARLPAPFCGGSQPPGCGLVFGHRCRGSRRSHLLCRPLRADRPRTRSRHHDRHSHPHVALVCITVRLPCTMRLTLALSSYLFVLTKPVASAVTERKPLLAEDDTHAKANNMGAWGGALLLRLQLPPPPPPLCRFGVDTAHAAVLCADPRHWTWRERVQFIRVSASSSGICPH
jgi:hypothetical protein